MGIQSGGFLPPEQIGKTLGLGTGDEWHIPQAWEAQDSERRGEWPPSLGETWREKELLSGSVSWREPLRGGSRGRVPGRG